MRQLTKVGKGRVEWREVAEPELGGPGEALVRPLAVALCDLDHLMVQGEAPIPGEIALGHEQVGEIVAVGDDVADHRVGDLVVVPFQISCGECDFCRRGRTGDCAAVPPQSMYGFGMVGGDWGGALSDLVRVPFADAMLVPLPAGLEPVSLASAGDNVVDGWRTVFGPLSRRPQAPVLVVGGLARSVGLYAVDAALALGAESVTYVDADPARLAVAADLGAQAFEGTSTEPLGRFPVTVDASASPRGPVERDRSHGAGWRMHPRGHPLRARDSTPAAGDVRERNPAERGAGDGPCRPAGGARASPRPGGCGPSASRAACVPWEAAPEAVLEFETKLVVTR